MNLFTVDLEEWWSVNSFKHIISNDINAKTSDRIDIGIDILLNLFERHKCKATFFVLGRIANKYPEIIKKIYEAGHAIGTHGYSHKLLYEQNINEFENDLKESLKVLEKITGKTIDKYRAPSYSIRPDTLNVLEILISNGIKYDSSIMPARSKRFGLYTNFRNPFCIEFPNGNMLIEIPPNVFSINNFNIPVLNGFFFRAFPKVVLDFYIKQRNRKNEYAMIILHNWELDIYQPKIKCPFSSKIIHYYNLHTTLKKTIELLNTFDFYSSFDEVETEYTISFEELKRLNHV